MRDDQSNNAQMQPRPRRKIGGVQTPNTAPQSSILGVRDQTRMLAKTGMAPQQQMADPRQAKIAAARADGTFATKRDTFNKGNRSSYMDEMGQIGPRADTNLRGLDEKKIGSGGSLIPGSSPGSSVWKANAPVSNVAANTPPMTQKMTVSKETTVTPAPTVGTAKPAGGAFTTSMKDGSKDLYAMEKASQKPGLGDRVRGRIGSGTMPSETDNKMMVQAEAIGNAAKSIQKSNWDMAESNIPDPKKRIVTPPGTPAASSSVVASTSPAATPRIGTGFTGAAGEEAAKKAVEQKRSERDATDLSRYKAEDAQNAHLNYPMSASGHSGVSPSANSNQIKKDVAEWRKKNPDYSSQNVAAREDGGPIKKDKPYLVGENGPEVVVPKQDGTVIPNPKALEKKRIGSRSILSGKNPRGSSVALASLAKWVMGK